MKIFIIRHGDPDYAKDSLTEKGFREAEMLAEKLAGEGITDIFCSPLGRAKATAAPTAEKLGLNVEILDWLRQIPVSVKPPYEELGIKCDWPSGCPWNLMPQYWTRQCELFSRDKWFEHPLYDGTKVKEIYDGIGSGFETLMGRYGCTRDGLIYNFEKNGSSERNIALFCHLGMGLALLSYITTAPLPFMWETFFLPTSSVTTLLAEKYPPYDNQAVLRIISVGDTGHLYASGEPVSSSGLHTNLYTKQIIRG